MRVRRTLMVSLFSAVLAAPLLLLGLTANGATIDTPGVSRLAGADRYETSAAIAKTVFETPSSVFLAAGNNFPDALSAGPAAAGAAAPVLLTKPTSLPSATLKELERTRPGTVYVLGGSASVSNSVATTARDYAGTVVRLGGANRYDTSVAVSKRFWSESDVVYLATGAGYADALSGGALAAKNSAPVLLSAPTALPSVIDAELRRLKPAKVVLLGGTGSLSPAVQTAVHTALPEAAVSRLAGQDRFATSAAVVAAGWNTSARAFYANGVNFPDALSGVPAAAVNAAPLLLTKSNCMPTSIHAASKALAPTTQVLLGGRTVLANNVTSTACSPGTSLQTAIGQLKTANENGAGYDRSLFRHWIDADRDCQDTRAEVLVQESLVKISGCTIKTGKWFSYYDRQTWTQASDVDIDHLVPLAEAWRSGARSWNPDTRERYANDLGDPRALVAVTDNVNQSKGDRDPSNWLPQYERCRYVAEWTAVKLRWSLTVDRTEKSTLLSVADGCPAITLTWKKAPVTDGEAPPPPPGLLYEKDILPPPPPDLDCSEIEYRNFIVRPGDPHRFDSDGDGIGCES